ncbi:hypothetical protein OAV71_04720 [Opitutales bacterium]|nr:hypothetical protein [Opitutales bacterium]
MINTFLASLLSKRFLILTGLSGSGKTQIALSFAKWLSNTSGTSDPFTVGTKIGKTYHVNCSDSLSVEFWNNEDPEAENFQKVTLPRGIILEWANLIKANDISSRILEELQTKAEFTTKWIDDGTDCTQATLEITYQEVTFEPVSVNIENASAVKELLEKPNLKIYSAEMLRALSLIEAADKNIPEIKDEKLPVGKIQKLLRKLFKDGESFKTKSLFGSNLHNFESHLFPAALHLLNDNIPASTYELIAIGADWTGNENILGYPDGLDPKRYVSTKALELIINAERNKDIPFFLILDEMNLSHVERYFSDILSAIEAPEEGINLHAGKQRFADSGILIPRSVKLPENLFIIGTVNVDETTYMFSPKVLDRANVIEFRVGEAELQAHLAQPKKPNLALLQGGGVSFGDQFVHASKAPLNLDEQVKALFEKEILAFFNLLKKHNAEFGYRVIHEASRFIHFYQEIAGHSASNADSWFDQAFDCVIIQKFLPKLHGSRGKLEPLLTGLSSLCTKRFPSSEKKIHRMLTMLKDNGFASFAEA